MRTENASVGYRIYDEKTDKLVGYGGSTLIELAYKDYATFNEKHEDICYIPFSTFDELGDEHGDVYASGSFLVASKRAENFNSIYLKVQKKYPKFSVIELKEIAEIIIYMAMGDRIDVYIAETDFSDHKIPPISGNTMYISGVTF